jgi:hypothetical protein
MGGKETEEIEKAMIRNGDLNMLNFAVNCLRQTENVLEMKKNEIENSIKYTTQGVSSVDLAVAYFKQTTNILKRERDEMEQRLKSDSLGFSDDTTSNQIRSRQRS